MEKRIRVYLGDGTVRIMPTSKLQKAKEQSNWLVENAIKSGLSRKRAEELFAIQTIEEID